MERVGSACQIKQNQPGSVKLSNSELSKLSNEKLMEEVRKNSADYPYILPILCKLVEKDDWHAINWINGIFKRDRLPSRSAEASEVFACFMLEFSKGSSFAWFMAESMCKDKRVDEKQIILAEIEFAKLDKQSIARDLCVKGNIHYQNLNYAEAHDCYMQSQFLGNAQAMLSVAVMYEFKEHVVLYSEGKVRHYLEKAHAAGVGKEELIEMEKYFDMGRFWSI